MPSGTVTSAMNWARSQFDGGGGGEGVIDKVTAREIIIKDSESRKHPYRMQNRMGLLPKCLPLLLM